MFPVPDDADDGGGGDVPLGAPQTASAGGGGAMAHPFSAEGEAPDHSRSGGAVAAVCQVGTAPDGGVRVDRQAAASVEAASWSCGTVCDRALAEANVAAMATEGLSGGWGPLGGSDGDGQLVGDGRGGDVGFNAGVGGSRLSGERGTSGGSGRGSDGELEGDSGGGGLNFGVGGGVGAVVYPSASPRRASPLSTHACTTAARSARSVACATRPATTPPLSSSFAVASPLPTLPLLPSITAAAEDSTPAAAEYAATASDPAAADRVAPATASAAVAVAAYRRARETAADAAAAAAAAEADGSIR
ncbi:hypothetical protein MMPV_001122 [Pyropia vietnamensis]